MGATTAPSFSFCVLSLCSLQVSPLSPCVTGSLIPRAASWWQQVGLAVSTASVVLPCSGAAMMVYKVVRWYNVFKCIFPSYTSSSVPHSPAPSICNTQMVAIGEISWSTWNRLQTRLWRSAGRSKSSLQGGKFLGSQQQPLFTLAAGNGAQLLAHGSLETHIYTHIYRAKPYQLLSGMLRIHRRTHYGVSR